MTTQLMLVRVCCAAGPHSACIHAFGSAKTKRICAGTPSGMKHGWFGRPHSKRIRCDPRSAHIGGRGRTYPTSSSSGSTVGLQSVPAGRAATMRLRRKPSPNQI